MATTSLKDPQVPKISKKSRFGTLLSRSLPNYTGPLPVGVCNVEVPVERQTFGTFHHRKRPESEASLVMENVVFSIFYPAEDGSKIQQCVWFPK